MSKPSLKALLLITACALSTGAIAEKTYRCGTSYSQAPCPGGIILDTTDERSSDQKKQADLATKRDASVANEMEKTRLQNDKKQPPTVPWSNTANPSFTNFDVADGPANVHQRKKKGAEYFTAKTSGEKKTKKAATKKVPQKKTSASS